MELLVPVLVSRMAVMNAAPLTRRHRRLPSGTGLFTVPNAPGTVDVVVAFVVYMVATAALAYVLFMRRDFTSPAHTTVPAAARFRRPAATRRELCRRVVRGRRSNQSEQDKVQRSLATAFLAPALQPSRPTQPARRHRRRCRK